ncbi:MAG: hypothetical protein DPW16_09725 [Chloroflexi bacterium]|nr:hypothetical protein [Chloroflexota bacterium]
MTVLRFGLVVALIGLSLLGSIPSTQAATPLTFSGSVGTFLSNTIWTYVDADSYTVYAEAGQIITLDLVYSGSCGFASARLDTSIGTVVGSLNLPPGGGSGYVTFNGTQTYSRVMPSSGAVEISVTINSITLGGIPSGCSFLYEMTVTGATLAPIAVDDPTLAAEAAAGLARVHDSSLPVVIYTPAVATNTPFIDIRDLTGVPLLYVSAKKLLALPDFPAKNTLIAKTADGFISVYKLTTGEYQVNVGPLDDGKVHVIIFDGIPRTHTYGYTFSYP